MFYPHYAMFFDNHTPFACPDTGHALDAEHFADRLQECGVDLVGFHAKCNQGFCYFKTETGIRHPALPPEQDLFGEVVRACGKRGIKVSAYLNCGLSYEDALRHPDWCRIGFNGEILHPDIYDLGWSSPYMRTMCPNSPWRDHLMKLIGEVRDRYPVAGFLFDSFNVFPCVCPRCSAEMIAQGLDPHNETDVMEFARKSIKALACDISKFLEPKKKHLLCYFLGVSSNENAEIGSYLECECLPTIPSTGYDALPFAARYLRNLADVPILNMTGRFYDWGDFGTLRTEAAIEYDLFFGLANGMRPNLSDHFPPSGKINEGVFDRATKIFRHLRQYQPWHDHAKPLTDIGVVLSSGMGSRAPEIIGLTRMLSELKLQFDFLPEHCDCSSYRLLILPDQVKLTSRRQAEVRAHIAAGKAVLTTGCSALDDSGNFLFETEFGVKYLRRCAYDPAYFTMCGDFQEGLPKMPMLIGGGGYEVECASGTAIAAKLVSPYYNKGWDGVRPCYYTPPHRETNLPLFTLRNEHLVCCTFPLFGHYHDTASVDLKQAVANVLSRLLPEPLVRIAPQSFPSFARAFVTEQSGHRLLHLLNYVPEQRGKMLIVEEALTAVNVKIALRCDGMNPRQVRMQPEGRTLDFSVKSGYIHFTLPEMTGYALIEVI